MEPERLETDPHLLRLLATTYRRMVTILGLGWFAMMMTRAATVPPGTAGDSPWFYLVTIAVGLALAWHGFQLADQLDLAIPPLWAAGMFVPILHLVVLSVLSRKATAFCRTHGIRVGFLGPNLDDIAKLELKLAEARVLRR